MCHSQQKPFYWITRKKQALTSSTTLYGEVEQVAANHLHILKGDGDETTPVFTANIRAPTPEITDSK